ncbi:MAG: hypothetical protein WCA11_01080 [Terracidiphilus sp.]
MRVVIRGFILGSIAALLAASTPIPAQQAPDSFHWVDFHSQKDQDVIVWVSRAMEPEKWTAIREIGVEYDAALVVTTLRASPKAAPNADTFSVWSVSLTSHLVTPLFRGVNLRWAGWLHFTETAPREPGILYDDCAECAATTYFTTFHYDMSQHLWAARWIRAGRAIPVWTTNTPAGVALTQVYAVMADPDGRELVGTWNHFDYGEQKPPEDYVYQYDLDPWSSLERIQLLNGKQADAMKQRLCLAEDAVAGLARGQDSTLCHPVANKPHHERRETTTPANTQGRSVPAGIRH